SVGAPARVVRLSQVQLDATARALLPEHAGISVRAAMPRDPLVSNFEYAENLTYNPANFAPYSDWIERIASSVRAAPETVIRCPGGGPGDCLDREARSFVRRAFRDVVPSAALERYAELYVTSVRDVGFAQATRDLVAVTLASPRFAFRDEVHTDATG